MNNKLKPNIFLICAAVLVVVGIFLANMVIIGSGDIFGMVMIIDSTKPVINVEYPATGGIYVNVSQINYSFVEDNPDTCWFSNNSGTTNQSYVAMGTNFTGLISVNGTNTWTVYCNDSYNNTNYSVVIFIKDINPPTFANLKNLNRDQNESFSYDINASDALSSVDSYWLNQTANFTINISTGLMTNITNMTEITVYWLKVWVNDTLNNTNSGLFFINITDDTNPPKINITSPSASMSQSDIWFNATLNDTGSWCAVNWSAGNHTMNTTDNLNYYHYEASMSDGTYIAVFYCNDTSGNFNQTNITFTIDTSSGDDGGDDTYNPGGGSSSPGGGNAPGSGGIEIEFEWKKNFTEEEVSVVLSNETTEKVVANKTVQVREKRGVGLKRKERMVFSVSGSRHSIGVVQMTHQWAIVNISSDPIQLNMTPGTEHLVDIDGDGIDDVLVRLESIENNIANLIVEYLDTELPSPCEPDWYCEEWGPCVDGAQSRVCIDINECNTSLGKPVTMTDCEGTGCTPEWECTEWSGCVQGKMNRECTDASGCGTSINKPLEEQACGDWSIYVIAIVIAAFAITLLVYFYRGSKTKGMRK